MKVLFVGPSLSGLETAGVVRRGPARQGDVTQAVLDGATAIGLVDGIFEYASAVWHKEILFALSEGVTVLGAASMGALRAAECSAFGMIGIGEVFHHYFEGRIRDDDAVGQLHAPEELDYVPLTEALVNVVATLDRLYEQQLVSGEERDAISRAANAMFFKERTYSRIVAAALPGNPAREEELRNLLERARVDVKRQDALALVAMLQGLENERRAKPEWVFASTTMFQTIVSRLQAGSPTVTEV